MRTLVLVVLYILAVLLPGTAAKNFTIEVETIPHGRESIVRTQASDMRSTAFKSGDSLRADFCLRKTTNVTVANIRFSNDGGSDLVDINLDGQDLGSFSTSNNSNNGFNWNIFESSGSVGGRMSLSPARHSLEFSFTTDMYGVELDNILLVVEDENLEEDFLRCMAVCDSDIKLSDIKARDDIPSAELVQASHATFCVKDRNIQYNLFHKNVSEYRLTASSPRYKTLLNDDMSENFGCDQVSDVLWEFTDFTVLPTEPDKTTDNARLTFEGTTITRVIASNFTLTKDSRLLRQSNEDIGAGLTLTFKGTVPSFTVSLTHSSRDGDKTVATPTTANASTVTWSFPDFTWIKDSYNNVKVTIVVSEPSVLTVDTFKLERRIKGPDVNITLYEDSETIIVAVREDQTWLAGKHPGMVVKRSDQTETHLNITKITVSKVNRFTDGFNEIVQIQQDGEMKIKPMVLYGAQSVPYGTSFIMGQFNSSAVRPAALISSVVVDPFSLILFIGYVNTNLATMEINSKLEDTEIHITNATFTKDRTKYPIAGVRSTWVSDGNSDLDHVSANQNEPRSPIDRWQKLYGTAFSFFRQCVSHHNTQAPDLVLELLVEDTDTDRS